MKMISRSDISDTLWKWRYKVSHIGQSEEKTLSKYPPLESSIDDPKAPAPPSRDTSYGVDAVVKTFYEGRNSNDTYYNWVDYPPKQLSKSASKAQDRMAIRIYKTKDKDKPVISGRFALKYYMIEIQSPVLVSALKDIVSKEDVYLEPTETATFRPPFRTLYFCSEDIAALQKSSDEGSVVKSHLGLLLRVMGDVFGESRIRVRQLQVSGLISYELAWTFFPKNAVVYSWATNCELLSKVVDTSYKKVNQVSFLVLNCQVIVFDGETFAWKDQELEIPQFDGNRPISELPHYPLAFHADPEGVRARLSARGKKVLDFQGLTYCNYNGVGIYHEDGKKPVKHNVDGRILVDVFGYNKHHRTQGVREAKDPELQKNRILSIDPTFDDQLPPTGNGTASSAAQSSSTSKRLTEDRQRKNKEGMLARDEDLKFMSPVLEGFALKNKIWSVSFYVDDIEPMVWNDEAYDHLVYNEQQKDLVLSFVENHRGTKQSMDDVIKGKGQGLIILLSGPPGTGKTLTAEAVADRTRRPLFYLQAEDLGINVASLGVNIKKVFEMATEWNAVILLDEADVFMAERCPNDIARNELVSIFLRELEYFRGIIFLTTNLYDTIDGAFRSRVSIHLLFSPLLPEARLVLWRKFLQRLPPLLGEEESPMKDLNEEDLKELAMWDLNGREIKNAIKMVRSWCEFKHYDMTLSRLESGIKVTSPHVSKRDYTYSKDLYD
ncbi:P-loop containing nucleoside triphosphate hydrolase protein [Elaphomyces granulatus]